MLTSNKYEMVDRVLSEYESLHSLTVSSKWEEELMLKIGKKKKQVIPAKYVGLVCFMLLVNTVLVYKLIEKSDLQTSERAEMLLKVSDQLLIQSTALK